MSEKLYHREDYPFDLLADFGLTEEMILDLPESVHSILERGGYSPLLPLKIEQPFGYSLCHAKFALVQTETGVEVIFSPKMKELDLNQFTDEEKQLLLTGKAIVSDVFETSEEDEKRSIKAFVQIDKETNCVVYTPTQIIGRNLQSISSEFNLSAKDLESFWKGDIVTISTDIFEEGSLVDISIGINLFSENGVEIVMGQAEDWRRIVNTDLPEYSFGNDGCWINKDGLLSYVPENEFTPEINQILELKARQMGTSDNKMSEVASETSKEQVYSKQQSF